MKSKRFIKLLNVFCLILIVCACNNQKPSYKSEGKIIGFDNRTCVFCGGLEITFENDQTPTHPPFYRISNNPKSFDINDSTKFPINVSADWIPDPSMKKGNYIVITRFKIHK